MPRQLLAIGVVILAVLLLSLGLFAIACGGSSTTTTAAVTPTTVASTTTSVTPATVAETTTTAAPTTTTIAATTTVAAINAAALYASNCARCHKNVPSASAVTARAVIQSGRDSMPSFKSKLSAAQITALAAYVAAGGK